MEGQHQDHIITISCLKAYELGFIVHLIATST